MISNGKLHTPDYSWVALQRIKVRRLCGARLSKEEAVRALGELGADMKATSRWKGTAEQFNAILYGVMKLKEIFPEAWEPSRS